MNLDAEKIAKRTSERQHWLRWFILVAAAAVVVPMFLVVVNIAAFLSDPFGGNDEPSVVDPSSGFLQLTGWQLPRTAEILTNTNNHSGFKNDGDYTLVVRLSPGQLQSLIANDSNTWSDCPIAVEIADSAWSMPQHAGELYYAKKTSPSDVDWHRGHVVIVNPETGMVWIYEWKI